VPSGNAMSGLIQFQYFVMPDFAEITGGHLPCLATATHSASLDSVPIGSSVKPSIGRSRA
jgi:hypothetical protein